MNDKIIDQDPEYEEYEEEGWLARCSPETRLKVYIGYAVLAIAISVFVSVQLRSHWESWGKTALIVGGALLVLVIVYKWGRMREQGSLDYEERVQHILLIEQQLTLPELALEAKHSISLRHTNEHGTFEFQSVSPHTIPNGPIANYYNVEEEEQEQLAPPLPTAPPFSHLSAQIRPGHLFLAQGITAPIWGDVTDLLSTLDVGRPNTGKSTLLRCICAQVLIIGGKPVIFDPHGSILDDLGSSFECAESPQDIEDYSHIMDAHLTRRLKERREGRKIFKPMLLLIDEMPIIAEMAEEALPAIRRIVLEGRKVGMYALIAGQGVPAAILGGTLVRDAMASRYVFCTSPQQARMAGIENETAKQMMAILEDAGPGKAVLATSNRKPEIVAIPNTTTDDIRALLSRNGKHSNFSHDIGNEDVSGNISGDFRNVVESDEKPVHENVSEFRRVERTSERTPQKEVSPEIRNEIIRLREKGFTRTEIRDILHFNGEQFKIIKVVLDEYEQASNTCEEGL